MHNTQNPVSINRELKTRLFTMLFGNNSNKKNILSLYNALYDTNYTDKTEIIKLIRNNETYYLQRYYG